MDFLVNKKLEVLILKEFLIFSGDFEDGMEFYSGKDCINAVNLLKRSATADQLGNQLLQWSGAALLRKIQTTNWSKGAI